MLEVTQIQDRLNDVVGQLAVLDLAFSSTRISDCLEQDEVNGFSALFSDVSDSLKTIVSDLDGLKHKPTPEEKQKFLKAVRLANQIDKSIDPNVATN